MESLSSSVLPSRFCEPTHAVQSLPPCWIKTQTRRSGYLRITEISSIRGLSSRRTRAERVSIGGERARAVAREISDSGGDEGTSGNGFGLTPEETSWFESNSSLDEIEERGGDENSGATIPLMGGSGTSGGSRAGLFRTPISGGVQSATSAHDLPRPALAVRNLMEQARFAHLCTVMSRMHHRRMGYPFGSLVDFAPDSMGHPIFSFSPLAIHTRNLLEDSRCTLVVQIPGWSGLSNARVTIFGDVFPLPDDQQDWAHKQYIAKHQHGRAAKPPAPPTPGNGTVPKASGTTGNQNNSVVANQVVRASVAAPSTTGQLIKLSDKEYNDAATHIKEAEKKKHRLGLHALNLSEEDIRKIELLIPELQRISSEMDETLVYLWHFIRNQRGFDNVLTTRFLIEDFLKGWQQKQYYMKAESLESSINHLKDAINYVRNRRQGKQDESYTHLNKSPVVNQSEIENLLLKKPIDLKIPEKRERHINSGSNKRPRTTAHEQMRRSSVISSVDEVDNEEEECSVEKMENTFKNINLVLKDAAEKERERETRNKNGLGLPTRMDRLMIEGYMIPPRLLDSTKVFVGLGSAI